MKKPYDNINKPKLLEELINEGLYTCNPKLLNLFDEGQRLNEAIKKLNDYSLGKYESGKSIYDIYNDIVEIYRNNGYESEIDDAINYCKEQFYDSYNEEYNKLINEFNDDEDNPYNNPEYRRTNDNGYSASMGQISQQAAFNACGNLLLPSEINLPEILKKAIIKLAYYDIAQSYGLTR